MIKTKSKLAVGAMSAVMTAAATAGPATPPPVEPEASGSVLDSIHLFGTARLRYEYADFNKVDVKESNLLSLRARLGVKTDEIYGFKFLVEGEATGILSDKDKYGPFPPPNNNGRAVIADPDSVLLNRLQLSYNAKPIDTVVTVGRQYITFDDQRFIGAVGWRQNDQTFDAAVLQNKSIDKLTFTYAYVDQVNRIFGSDAPLDSLETFEGDSHLIHLNYDICDGLAARGFAYLLDFDNAASNSCDTYGLELQGDTEVFTDSKLNYLLTAAIQSDAGENTADYEEYYFRGQVGVKNDCLNYGLGAECMTSDGEGGRFLFPLGTNHKFNGFSDAFLTTPVDGLVDYYSWVGTKFLGFNHTMALHYFTTQHDSSELGWEIDYVAARQIGEYTKVILKGAYLDGKGDQFDITRASAEVNVTF
ncbi:alginate export family protein [Verrucomicrobiaceae bacterium N1E253]|uniref:Alginate export family protein n=1 Tax=Oceaniferula marina TaxID=2748318 RepID=A0A851GKV1_9BACT|nr:alginate export family protein [Oceaniferula marina]NWK55717.1 alginate export family protein [Oceaniferula marina]